MQGFKRVKLDLIPGGIANDAPPESVPPNVFDTGLNMVMRDGVPTRADGWAETLGAPLFDVEYLINIESQGVNYWVYGGRQGIGATDGNQHYDLTPANYVQTTRLNEWTGAVFNGLLVLNNGRMPPVFWPGTPAEVCEELPEWPEDTLCAALRVFQNHIIAMDITDPVGRFKDWFLWSDAAEVGQMPDSWTPAGDNEAGSAVLSATPGAIVDGAPLKNEFVLYKQSSTYAMRYIGGNFVFQIRKILDTSGIKSRNAVAESRGVHFVITDCDVIEFDGQSYISIADASNKNYLFKSLTATTSAFAFAVPNTLETEIYFFYPAQPSEVCNRALVWSRDSKAWGEIEIDSGTTFAARGIVPFDDGSSFWNTNTNTWRNITRRWGETSYLTISASILMCLSDNTLNNLGATPDRNGASVDAYLSKTVIDLGAQDRRKLFKRIWPRVEGANGTEIIFRIGAQDSPTESIRWGEEKTFIIGTTKKIDLFASGRFMALEVRSSGLQPWRITGLDIELNLQGGF